ncbi:hypothetical protein D0Y65_008925 [Glycine soja]|uniref:Uncharacterized protein n=1 Tax=Glycine soja TaxID=3848 RepID=A0A445KX17_GLYSO|nr:hypothetical protein D0Y65_008925 [Glycine soja]
MSQAHSPISPISDTIITGLCSEEKSCSPSSPFLKGCKCNHCNLQSECWKIPFNSGSALFQIPNPNPTHTLDLSPHSDGTEEHQLLLQQFDDLLSY